MYVSLGHDNALFELNFALGNSSDTLFLINVALDFKLPKEPFICTLLSILHLGKF